MRRILPALAALLLPLPSLAHTETAVNAEVALADWPMCDVFVVVAGRDFSVVSWRSGLWAWSEGDVVRGPVHEAGRHTITVVASEAFGEIGGEMLVEVQRTGLSLRQAQDSYYRACNIE